MARKPKVEVSSTNEETPVSKENKEFLKNIAQKKSLAKSFISKIKESNNLASVLTESTLSNIKEYISSGSFALNRVISGSYLKGWPNNRIYAVAGPSGVGKSFIMVSTAREALKKGYSVVYFDSEGAVDADFMRNLGVDPDAIIYIPVSTISEFRNQAVDIMTKWRSDPETKNEKLMMICDSIGGLAGTKETADAEEGKSASDMGQRAKELRSCARILMMQCAKNEVPLLVTNHTMEQANPMGQPTIKMTGGEGFVYATSGIIMLSAKQIKEDSGEKDSEGRKVINRNANIVIAVSEKNRLVPAGNRGYIYIDFKKGVNRLYGMLDDAIEHGYIEEKGGWFYIKHLDKKVREKDLYMNEIWQPIFKELNEKVENKYKYSVHSESESDITSETEEFKEDEPAAE